MPATDNFGGNSSSLDSPAKIALAISPDDANELPLITRAIYVGGDGDLTVVMAEGDGVTGKAATLPAFPVVVFVGLKAGTVLPIRARQVMATGTTATNLVGLV
ncbi:MAG: hypothetical protein Q9M33_13730 [Robiginitomaculum sp.]|nr:hypothetical protein [Robiginitomaculum sp.]